MRVEVLDERVDDLVRDQLAVAVRGGLVPVHGEDAAQLLVGGGDAAHGVGQHLADVLGDGQHVAASGSLSGS